MGEQTRRRTIAPWHRYDARSVVLFELRANLVRFDATRRRVDQSQIVRTFARAHASMGTVVEF